MAKKPDPTIVASFRLPRSLIARLDEHIKVLEERTPGVKFNRADVVKTLLTEALEKKP